MRKEKQKKMTESVSSIYLALIPITSIYFEHQYSIGAKEDAYQD
jgi:hypothetical protein